MAKVPPSIGQFIKVDMRMWITYFQVNRWINIEYFNQKELSIRTILGLFKHIKGGEMLSGLDGEFKKEKKTLRNQTWSTGEPNAILFLVVLQSNACSNLWKVQGS
jgi:hypothetical protein